MKITVLLGSSRANGNTEKLIETALDGVQAEIIKLADYNIKPIKDARHAEGGFQQVDDDYEMLIQKVLASDTLIFGTPLYWYGIPGHMKSFIDRWSQTLKDDRIDFKREMSQKQAFVTVVGGDNPKTQSLPLIQQYQLIFDFVGLPFTDYIIAKANRPGDIHNDKASLVKAAEWNTMFRKK